MRLKTFSPLFTFLLLFIAADSLYSAPLVKSTTEHYPVKGVTPFQLRSSLNNNSPVEVGGNRYDAYTHWKITWNLHYHHSKSKCAIAQLKTTIEIHQILPQLISKLSPQLHDKWLAYRRGLIEHEKNHKLLALQAASELERIILKTNPQNSCKTLEQVVNARGQSIINKYRSIQKNFDLHTNFGKSAGVIPHH